MSEPAVRLSDVSKMYRLYRHPVDRVLDALGINRWLFWRKDYYQAFWALRDVSLEVARGERLGIIGSNGAGKSTMLKLVTGNLEPTDGRIEVHGRVQALMEIGTGFHPEFTGRENIRASLAYQGLGRAVIRDREEEIIDFAELEEFIDQPVKTYSAGMYTRLAFSTATAIDPEILIIDEVLGAGDAYFAGKCVDRMKRVTEDSGATVLFVSHDMTSIQRLCTAAVWLDRGKVVMYDDPLTVAKAYAQQVQRRQEQRLKARNLKARQQPHARTDLDYAANTLVVRFATAPGQGEGFCLHQVRLCQDEEALNELRLGDAQDCDASHGSWVVADGQNSWTDPVSLGEGQWGRSLRDCGHSRSEACVAFRLLAYDRAARYRLTLQYVPPRHGAVEVEIFDGRQYLRIGEVRAAADGEIRDTSVELPALNLPGAAGKTDRSRRAAGSSNEVSRWPGTNEIVVRHAVMTDAEGQEKTIFRVGEPFRLQIEYAATADGTYPIIFTATLYTLDGVRVSCHVMDPVTLELCADRPGQVYLDFGPLNLGNGRYVFSIALYRNLDEDELKKPVIYDLVDRSYEFQVVGRRAIDCSIFHHPARWRLQDDGTGPAPA